MLLDMLRKTNSSTPGTDRAVKAYLAVAIYRKPDREAEACALFDSVLAHSEAPIHAPYDVLYEKPGDALEDENNVWVRACYSHLLRRIGRFREARIQENAVV